MIACWTGRSVFRVITCPRLADDPQLHKSGAIRYIRCVSRGWLESKRSTATPIPTSVTSDDQGAHRYQEAAPTALRLHRIGCGSAVKDGFDQRQDRQPARTNRNTTAAPFAMSSTPRSRKPPSTSTTTPGTVPRASATTPDPAHRWRSSSAIRRRRRLLSPPANRSTTWQAPARPLPAPKSQATTHRLPRLSLRSSDAM